VTLQEQREKNHRQDVECDIEAIESGTDDPIPAFRQTGDEKWSSESIDER